MSRKPHDSSFAASVDANSPSVDFLDFVRGLARNQDLAGIAVAFQFFCRARPASQAYVRGRLPAIVMNHYFTRRDDLDYDKFVNWCVHHSTAWSEMAESIRDGAFSHRRLAACTDRVVVLASSG